MLRATGLMGAVQSRTRSPHADKDDVQMEHVTNACMHARVPFMNMSQREICVIFPLGTRFHLVYVVAPLQDLTHLIHALLSRPGQDTVLPCALVAAEGDYLEIIQFHPLHVCWAVVLH